MTMIYS